MTQDISRLMDGDLEHHEVDPALTACKCDEGLDTWSTYQLIGDAMRGESLRRSRVFDRVCEELANEPSIIARPRRVASVTRVGLALAASVATVAVVGWIGFQQGGAGVSPAGPMVVRAPEAPNGTLSPASTAIAANDALGAPAQPAGPRAVVRSQDVNEYLVVHRQIASPDYYRPVAATGR